MGLACGRERLLDPDVQLLGAGAKPAASAAADRLGLRQLLHPEQAAVERARLVSQPGGAATCTWSIARIGHVRRSFTIGPCRQSSRTPSSAATGGSRPRRRGGGSTSSCGLSTSSSRRSSASLLLPVAAVIALVLVATSGRPVLYRGERVGRGARFFTMLKFRTLTRDAESRLGPYLGEELVRRTEAEYTRFGRWLKASQLDEIPQL